MYECGGYWSMKYKIRWFISPDNVLIEEDICCHLKYFSIISNKKEPCLSICKTTKYSNNVMKLDTLYLLNLFTEFDTLQDDILYQNINIEHNTGYYSKNLFFNAWSVQGMLEHYLSSAIHTPHISLFKHNNEVLIKTTFPTLFKDKIYPNIININFEDIVKQYLPQQSCLFNLHKQRELNYLAQTL